MLSIDQYQSLASLIPSINAALRKEGIAIAGADGNDVQETSSIRTKKAGDAKKESTKANIDATSDEEED